MLLFLHTVLHLCKNDKVHSPLLLTFRTLIFLRRNVDSIKVSNRMLRLNISRRARESRRSEVLVSVDDASRVLKQRGRIISGCFECFADRNEYEHGCTARRNLSNDIMPHRVYIHV